MSDVMDAFIQAVADAKHRLNRLEGRTVSERELIRRAGFTESQRAGVSHHLNPNKWSGSKGHNVPPRIVDGLAKALEQVVSHEELSRAAQTAAGHNVTVDLSADMPTLVARYFESPDVPEDVKKEATQRLLAIVAEEAGRRVNH